MSDKRCFKCHGPIPHPNAAECDREGIYHKGELYCSPCYNWVRRQKVIDHPSTDAEELDLTEKLILVMDQLLILSKSVTSLKQRVSDLEGKT